MAIRYRRAARALLWAFAMSGWLAACGGGSGSGGDDGPDGGSGADNTTPVATMASPAAGATFQAGDTIAFEGAGTDEEDGELTGTALMWRVVLHDGDRVETLAEAAGASGSVVLPVRDDVSDALFYRFHLFAIDSDGATHEVTRDILPRTAELTFVTRPAGLQILVDGSFVDDGDSLVSVVGAQRKVLAGDQKVDGRSYRFTSWNDGGAAGHTVTTPAADTTYIATFTEVVVSGNEPPSVSLSAPSTTLAGTTSTLTAVALDIDGDNIVRIEFFVDGDKIGDRPANPATFPWTPAAAGTYEVTARATDAAGQTGSASVSVTVLSSDPTAPTVALVDPAPLATGLSGVLTVRALATDNLVVQSVEFQIDAAPIGAPVAVGSAEDTVSVTLDAGLYTAGQHVIRARARDSSGNLSAWASALVEFGGTRTEPAGFTRSVDWVGGLSNATAIAQAPDGRLFVAEQGGTLRVVKNGVLLPTPFMTIPVDATGERGLLGVALHPDFASNGLVYVYATRSFGGVAHNRISRFTANGDVADASGETLLVDLPTLSSSTNHNGGAMHFGLDGKLYVGVGDNDSPLKAQDITDTFGKLLRFNDDGTIPTDNPFFAIGSDVSRAVWAYGLRNPFTFGIHPSTGRIHINDVGDATWEEIDLGAPGANYGWPDSEGPDNVGAGITAPLFSYKHTAATPRGSGTGGFVQGAAIAGGTFYPDSGPFPASYRSQYYFADFSNGRVWRLDLLNGVVAYAFARMETSTVDLLTGADGALYVLTRTGVSRIAANP